MHGAAVTRGQAVATVSAVTVKTKAVPAVTLVGALIAKCVAVALLMLMVALPEIELVTVSVAGRFGCLGLRWR